MSVLARRRVLVRDGIIQPVGSSTRLSRPVLAFAASDGVRTGALWDSSVPRYALALFELRARLGLGGGAGWDGWHAFGSSHEPIRCCFCLRCSALGAYGCARGLLCAAPPASAFCGPWSLGAGCWHACDGWQACVGHP